MTVTDFSTHVSPRFEANFKSENSRHFIGVIYFIRNNFPSPFYLKNIWIKFISEENPKIFGFELKILNLRLKKTQKYLHGQYFSGMNFRIGRGISIKRILWLWGPINSERQFWILSAAVRISFVPCFIENPTAIANAE